ncbi:MAG: hypothetical protein IPG00_20655 [Saprospiraceae bacterium]|nr:hypothetical protein [Saprospiraceae bacterium]
MRIIRCTLIYSIVITRIIKVSVLSVVVNGLPSVPLIFNPALVTPSPITIASRSRS